MRKLLLKFGRYLAVLTLVASGAGPGGSAQVANSPVFAVDNSEKQEMCNTDPSLIAYPCFRTIQEAVGRASGSSIILVLPTGQPHAGFELRGGNFRALLIQGFRGLPTVQGNITIEGEFQVILRDLIVQGDPAISIGVSSSGPLFTRLQGLQIESNGTAVRLGHAALVEVIDSALCGGSCAQPGKASGCGIELAFNGRGTLALQSTSIWGFQNGICTKGAQPSRALFLSGAEIAFNAEHGMSVSGDPTQPQSFFLNISQSKIQFNGRDGLRLENLQGFVWSNQVFFNARHGIVLDGSGEVDISYNNAIAGNGDCGVLRLLSSMRVTGFGNKIFGNGRNLCGDFPPDFQRP